MGKSDKIKQFLVRDLFNRASETIKSLAEGDYSKVVRYTYFKLFDMFRAESEVEAILDPNNLILLSKEFIEQNYVGQEELP